MNDTTNTKALQILGWYREGSFPALFTDSVAVVKQWLEQGYNVSSVIRHDGLAVEPAPSATTQGDTLARTGNTAAEQAMWFDGMGQGQANERHNAQVRAETVALEDAQPKDWKAIEAAIDEYLDGYELRLDEGCHTPTEFERFLLSDAVAGLLSEDEILALLAGTPAAPAAGDALDAARYRFLRRNTAPLRLAEQMGIPRKQVKRSDDPAARVDEMCDAALAAQVPQQGEV